ncbi:MAG: sulfatase [Blautia sp.]|jgi:arylsulfatase A-like enzyme
MRTVLILMDTLNRRYLKTYDKNARGITPNIDKFAEESVIFENHFIGSAPCMPARRDIFTGRMQFLERGWGGIEPFDITLPEMLRKHKIFTHITTDHTHYFEIGGENYCQLFDTWDYHRGQEFDTWVSKIRKPQIDREAYGKKSSQYLLNKTRFLTEADYPTPKTFRSACQWAEENAECDDFFLMVESFDPHEPFDTPKEYLELYEKKYKGREFNWPSYEPVTEPAEAVKHLENCYLATMTMADRWLGKFIESLKKNNLYEDTLIILTTDHGHMLGEHGYTGKNFMHAYNELAHIPLMIKFPQNKFGKKRVTELTQNIDLMPTILGHHKCKIPDTVKGINLSELLQGNVKPREQVIYGWFGRAVNVYDGRYTYFRSPQNEKNQPCYQYFAMPSTVWRYFGNDYAQDLEMGRFLPYTDYPVYRLHVKRPEDYSGDISYVKKSLLFDIKSDYKQQIPIENPELEKEMCMKLIRGMKEAQSPKEQYERLGLQAGTHCGGEELCR